METKKAMRNRIYDLERANAQMQAELEAERKGDGELARLREAQLRDMTAQIRQMQRVVDDAIADVGRTKAEFDRTLRDVEELERENVALRAELEAERSGDGGPARLRESQFRAMADTDRLIQRVVDDAIADVGRTKAEFDRTLRDVEELERARARLIGIANDENLRRLLAEHHMQESAEAAEALAWAAKTLQRLCAAASGELLPLAVRLEDDPSQTAQEIGETLEEISRTLAPEIDWTDPAQIRALREKGGAADGD